jgi:hypothetical protein
LIRKASVLTDHIQGILLITGGLTATLVAGVVAPGLVLRVLFLRDSPSPGEKLAIRHWSLLIALFGVSIVYAAYQPSVRSLVLTGASVEKLGIGAFVATSPARNLRLGLVAGADAIMGLLYVSYLVGLS